MSPSPQVDVSRSLARVVNDEEFLILDDDETDSTQAKLESRKSSNVQSRSETSASMDSQDGLISSIQGMLGEGVGKIRSSISGAREKKAAKVAPVDELILDDGSLEKVSPIAGECVDYADFMEAMFHCPPSPIGSPSRKPIVRSSTGRSAVSIIAS